MSTENEDRRLGYDADGHVSRETSPLLGETAKAFLVLGMLAITVACVCACVWTLF